MNNIKSVFADLRRKAEFVLPSGVFAKIQEPSGSHQSLITKNEANKRKKGIIKMLQDCIVQIGSNTNITNNDYQKLLGEDVKYLLFRLGLLSSPDYKDDFGYTDVLRFKFEFPTKGGRRITENVVIEIDDDNFPVKPYKWVKEEMISDYKQKLELDDDVELTKDQELECFKNGFEAIYATYDEMLEKNSQQKAVLKKLEDFEIEWKVLDIAEQEKFGKLLETNDQDINTVLKMRAPKYEMETEKNGFVTTSLPIDNMPSHLLEELKSKIFDVEGEVNTQIVVASSDDSSLQQQIDLTQTPAFFFRSLGK